jgi:Tfp pilus assembly protein PilF
MSDRLALYNKACCYGVQNQDERASKCLKRAIDLDAKYRDMAKTDTDFDSLREAIPFRTAKPNEFQRLVEGD